MTWLERTRQYALLMRVHRPIGALLFLWPTLWALWVAGSGRPDARIVVVFVTGVFLMRSAGCVINDYADRHVDPHVERTRSRPIAAGGVSPGEAIGLFLVLCLAAFALVLMLNRLSLLLSLLGLALAASYPFVKRVTHLPQFYLGIAFSWGIPMAFAAQTDTLPGIVWLLVAANLCWVVAYDTLYAMVDREDDRKVGVRSTAILFGAYDRLLIAVFHLGALVLLALAGSRLGLNGFFYGGLALAAVFAIFQQYLCRSRMSAGCFAAFVNNSWFGAAVFAGLVLAYL